MTSEDSFTMEDAMEEAGWAVGAAVGLSRVNSSRESRRKMRRGLSTQVLLPTTRHRNAEKLPGSIYEIAFVTGLLGGPGGGGGVGGGGAQHSADPADELVRVAVHAGGVPLLRRHGRLHARLRHPLRRGAQFHLGNDIMQFYFSKI